MAGADRDVFVGRQGELRTLVAALGRARRGRPGLVFVEGDAGMGKTALLREFLRARPELRPVWASGDESELALRFGVLEQLRSSVALGNNEGAARPAIGGDSFAAGAELLELFASPAHAMANHADANHAGPTVVIVDDLHWADEASSQALLFWLRRLRQDYTLVLCAARPHATERLGDSWARLLADSGFTRRIRLEGLATDEVAVLAGGPGPALPDAAAERLRAHTAGNPLYVVGLAAELPDEVLRDPSGSLPAPHSYAATVLARTARLSPPARELIAAAAVLGTRCRLATALATAGMTTSAGLLDELHASQIIEVGTHDSIKEMQFWHPLMRAAVYDDMSPSRRRSLHLAAADLLPGAVALSHRVAAAEGADPALVTELVTAAEADLVAGAPRQAATQLFRAAHLAPDGATAQRHRLRGVELLLVSGDLAGARWHAAEVQAGPPSDQRTYVVSALAAATGDLTGARTTLAGLATSRLEQTDPPLYAQVTSSLALLDQVLGDVDAAIAHAQVALDVPDAAASSRAIAMQALALGLAVSGRPNEALATLPSLATAAEPGPFAAELLMTRAMIRVWAGQGNAAISDLHTVIAWAKAGHPLTSIATAYAFLADAEGTTGDHDNAIAHAELSVSLAENLGHVWYLAYAHRVATELYARLGEGRFAELHAAQAEQAAAQVPHPLAVAHAAVARAVIAACAQNRAAVRRALEPLQRGTAAAAATHPAVAGWLVLAADAGLEPGEPDGIRDEIYTLGPVQTDPLLDGLTNREQVVARLVRRGLTNREIAAELYVTSKTIEYHLSNIFAKLGISRRRDLGRSSVAASSRSAQSGS